MNRHYTAPGDQARQDEWLARCERAARAGDHRYGHFEELGMAMEIAVTIEIDNLQGKSFDERLTLGSEGLDMLLCSEDTLYGGKFCRESFRVLARVVAVLAYQPGGVYAFGRRWAAVPVAEAEAEVWPDEESRTWVHPDDHRRGLLARWVGEEWTARSGLLGEYQHHGWTDERLELDLLHLRGEGRIEEQKDTGWKWWRRKPASGATP